MSEVQKRKRKVLQSSDEEEEEEHAAPEPAPSPVEEQPPEQKEALAYQVKRPMLVTNVLLRSSEAADRLGISGAYCPGRLHGATWLVKGIEVGAYRHDWSDPGPAVMQFWGSVAPAEQGLDAREQHRSSRTRLLAMEFEDFEREVRTGGRTVTPTTTWISGTRSGRPARRPTRSPGDRSGPSSSPTRTRAPSRTPTWRSTRPGGP